MTRVCSVLGLMLFVSCAVGPNFVRPDAPRTKWYTNGAKMMNTSFEGQRQDFVEQAEVPERWWSLFKQGNLDAVVEKSLAGNPSLQAALATLKQSEANLRAGAGIFYPQANATASASRNKFSSLGFGQNSPASTFSLFTLSGAVSYVLDIFGGHRRTVEGLGAQVEYQRYAALAAYNALTGNVVNTLIARAGYQAQVKATEELIALIREEVSITAAQVESGAATYAALLSLQAQLASTIATLPLYTQRTHQAEHLLAVLLGELPSEAEIPKVALEEISLPRFVPVSVPSTLVRRRPDILAAEAQLHVSNANIGIATAALFPSFTLDASFGRESHANNELFSAVNGGFWSFGGSLTAPLFRGGALWAQKEASEEAYKAALGQYRQTVLSGFQQVADYLRALENDAETVRARTDELKAAQEALMLVRANYQSGVSTYLELLNANAQYLQAKISYIDGITQRLQDTVALFVALGGGWEGEKGAPHRP